MGQEKLLYRKQILELLGCEYWHVVVTGQNLTNLVHAERAKVKVKYPSARKSQYHLLTTKTTSFNHFLLDLHRKGDSSFFNNNLKKV